MKQKWNMDALDWTALLGGLVFFAPVSLLVRTTAGVSLSRFFLLQAIVSFVILVAEIPCGKLTDVIGYQKTIVLSHMMTLLARVCLFVAYCSRSFALFAAEAVIEGVADSLSSGTQSAYIYTMFPKEAYARKTAHVANFGTIGFFISTLAYAGMYAWMGMKGLLLATIAANALAVLIACSLPQEKPVCRAGEKRNEGRVSIGALLFRKQVLGLMLVLAALSMGRILINFFYAEKLIRCGISETWMSAVILGYSAVELLAEVILAHTSKARQGMLMAGSFVSGGAVLTALGLLTEPILVLPAMLILPLMLDVPDYLLGAVQNGMIDAAGQEEKRAEVLSVFNMGIHMTEVFFLLSSSFLAQIGAQSCFVLLGAFLLAVGLVLPLCRKKLHGEKIDIRQTL